MSDADDMPPRWERRKQPDTRPISQEQLVAEVKGIYAGLVMVESKCIEVDNQQFNLNKTSPELNHEQWQALIELHRTLLHEHHDFFLSSQHPSASPALRRLASKYAMPARMWRHGIHSFLELLRHKLPESRDHMLSFIYLAYSMMALLYETVPAFTDTWIECLGDLGRYRVAIEEDNMVDRQIWTEVSRSWYSKASDRAPTTGRLYHHLAILAQPDGIKQLFYYTKALCVSIPFQNARESVMTLFEPPLNGSLRTPAIDLAYAKSHTILFADKQHAEFETAKRDFLGALDNHIAKSTRRFIEPGQYIAIANGNLYLEDGLNDHLVYLSIDWCSEESRDSSSDVSSLQDDRHGLAQRLRVSQRSTYASYFLKSDWLRRMTAAFRHALCSLRIAALVQLPALAQAAPTGKGFLEHDTRSSSSQPYYDWTWNLLVVSMAVFLIGYGVFETKTQHPHFARVVMSAVLTWVFGLLYYDESAPARAKYLALTCVLAFNVRFGMVECNQAVGRGWSLTTYLVGILTITAVSTFILLMEVGDTGNPYMAVPVGASLALGLCRPALEKVWAGLTGMAEYILST